MRNKATITNIDNSNPAYLNGRIVDDNGSGNGTPVNEFLYGDKHQFFEKLMALAGISPNGQPENEINGYQLIDALHAFANKNNLSHNVLKSGSNLTLSLKLDPLKINEIIIGIAQFNYTNENKIIGSDASATLYNLNVKGSFLNGDYLLIRKTSTGFEVESLATYSVLKNENFPEIKKEENDSLTNTIFEDATTTAFTYITYVRKSGNSVTVEGVISTGANSIFGNEGVLKIKNTTYYPFGDIICVTGFGKNKLNNTDPAIHFGMHYDSATKSLKSKFLMPANYEFTFNFTYFIYT